MYQGSVPLSFAASPLSKPTQFAWLRMHVRDPELKELYRTYIDKHNEETRTQSHHNSGFDVFFPEQVRFDIPMETVMVPLGIKTEMYLCDCRHREPTSFYLMPRSSLSKTPLMLANHVGLMDSSYRGEAMAAFRCLYQTSSEPFVAEKHARYVQISHPTGCPIYVALVDDEDDFTVTSRGAGGFGSTGVVGISAPIHAVPVQPKRTFAPERSVMAYGFEYDNILDPANRDGILCKCIETKLPFYAVPGTLIRSTDYQEIQGRVEEIEKTNQFCDLVRHMRQFVQNRYLGVDRAPLTLGWRVVLYNEDPIQYRFDPLEEKYI